MSHFLPRGCRVGMVSVHPANWESLDADLSITWYVFYRFHDPNYRDKYPKGYPKQLRGMNEASTLSKKRLLTRGLIQNELRNLYAGYNPILNKIVASNDLEISPLTPLPDALERAQKMLRTSPSKKEVGKALVHINKAIKQLRYDGLSIGEVKRRHMLAVMQKVADNKLQATGREWGPDGYNHYRSYLIMLFKQLDRCEAVEIDLNKLEIRPVVKKIRQVLTSPEIDRINDQVKAKYYTFWRFIHIFFHSGARMTELMQVRTQDLDLPGQRFKVTIKKGRGQIQEVWKTITRAAVLLWEEIASEATKGDYLFSRGLKPGARAINEHQVTKRWRVHIKNKLSIEADFYSLKHKNTTEIVSRVVQQLDEGARVAAAQNSHHGTAMVIGIYDVERQSRQHDRLKDSTEGLQ